MNAQDQDSAAAPRPVRGRKRRSREGKERAVASAPATVPSPAEILLAVRAAEADEELARLGLLTATRYFRITLGAPLQLSMFSTCTSRDEHTPAKLRCEAPLATCRPARPSGLPDEIAIVPRTHRLRLIAGLEEVRAEVAAAEGTVETRYQLASRRGQLETVKASAAEEERFMADLLEKRKIIEAQIVEHRQVLDRAKERVRAVERDIEGYLSALPAVAREAVLRREVEAINSQPKPPARRGAARAYSSTPRGLVELK